MTFDFGLYSQIFGIIAPVFLCAALGFGWGKSGRNFDTEMVTTLASSIAVPCLVFYSVTQSGLSMQSLGQTFIVALCAMVLYGGLGLVVLKVAKLSYRDFLPSVMFPNNGNMGIPLCLLAFGEQGATLAIVVFAVCSMTMFTAGIQISSGQRSFRILFTAPMVYGVLLAMVFVVTGLQPPQFVVATTRVLGGMAVPLMLIALGVSLASLKVENLMTSLIVSVTRLGGGFLIGLFLVWIFRLDGITAGVIILQTTMPVAVMNFLLARRYENNHVQVAGMVVMSTMLSFLTLPFLLTFVL